VLLHAQADALVTDVLSRPAGPAAKPTPHPTADRGRRRSQHVLEAEKAAEAEVARRAAAEAELAHAAGFQAAAEFAGSREGWFFATGCKGLGYYLDPSHEDTSEMVIAAPAAKRPRLEPETVPAPPSHFTSLTSLTLDHDDAAGAAMMQWAGQSPTLRFLTVSGCFDVTDVGMRQLTNLTKLSSLKLYDCLPVTPAAIREISCLFPLPALSIYQLHDLRWVNAMCCLPALSSLRLTFSNLEIDKLRPVLQTLSRLSRSPWNARTSVELNLTDFEEDLEYVRSRRTSALFPLLSLTLMTMSVRLRRGRRGGADGAAGSEPHPHAHLTRPHRLPARQFLLLPGAGPGEQRPYAHRPQPQRQWQ
jgi:hypothetical protein